MAPNPDRELAEARACIDRGDERGALKRLDRARRGYVKQHDTGGLEHLFVLAAVLAAEDERTAIGRENLVYSVKQNLRAESRRDAQQRREPWQDPYPDLRAPTEHTRISLTRGVKIVIAIATALATAALIAILVAPWFFAETKTTVTLRLVNDAPVSTEVRGCNDVNCTSSWTRFTLGAGKSAERDVPIDDSLELFKLERPGPDTCLPLLVHEAYERAGADSTVTLVARLSKATSCPGRAVKPRALAAHGL